ncbi:uncharacterized protein ACBT44_007087 isoform 2-T2 [Syngnathus typhle]
MLPSAARRDVAVDQRDATSRQQLGGCLHKGQRSTRPGAVDEARTMLFRTLGPTLPSCLSPHAYAQNTTCPLKATPPSHELPLCLSADSVRRALAAINIRKVAGPDNIPGRALKDCAGELTGVFTDIFNTSLQQAIVPSCFKAAIIVPVPKKPAPSCFNDYRPVALTPIIMKCFERLVMEHIRSVLLPPLTPSSLRTEPNGPLRMPSALPSTRPSPTWREGTLM